MLIKAISQIIEWDAEAGRSCIINKGEEGEASEALAMRLIEEGVAEAPLIIHAQTNPPVHAPILSQLDHDGDGEPGGSDAPTGDDITALRAEYKELAGKGFFPGWDAAELHRRIDALKADAAPADDAPAA